MSTAGSGMVNRVGVLTFNVGNTTLDATVLPSEGTHFEAPSQTCSVVFGGTPIAMHRDGSA